MDRKQILGSILGEKIVTILRLRKAGKVLPTAQAILKGGIRVIEVSLNTPDALDCLADLSRMDGAIVGVGTMTSKEMVSRAIEAGAQFIVSPINSKEIIDAAYEMGKPVFSGGFSPTEIFQAHQWGADVVKVFPADILGMKYIRAIKAPFPEIKLMPTGGVTPDNIDKWFDIGACCVGIGSGFTKQDIIENEEWGRLTRIAQDFSNNISHYKTNFADK
jgi:2-dehydro-3-deoxyphosphogluconate aldolase/(4S)-4-hydroxy-2-oxoglutarate aldolase